ncbi:MAG: hypothetical protein WAU36_06630 [Cyclobacteriaceae bacterium]
MIEFLSSLWLFAGGYAFGQLFPIARGQRTAEHYCDVLNKVIWKTLTPTFSEDDLCRIASEANERLLYDNPRTKWRILWDSETSEFIVEKI